MKDATWKKLGQARQLRNRAAKMGHWKAWGRYQEAFAHAMRLGNAENVVEYMEREWGKVGSHA